MWVAESVTGAYRWGGVSSDETIVRIVPVPIYAILGGQGDGGKGVRLLPRINDRTSH